MSNKLFALLAVAAIFTTTACMRERDSALDRAPGKYERSVSSTDAQGTTVKEKTSTKVKVDQYGKKKAIVKSKTSTDPKGLFNKRTTKSKEVIEEDDNY